MSSQSIKTLEVFDILKSQSDENHPISLREMTSKLSKKGIFCERKSLYKSLKALEGHGVKIVYAHRRGYYIKNRGFSVGQIQILLDIIAQAKFLDFNTVESLARELKKSVSAHQAKELNTKLSGRERTQNSKVCENLEQILCAISKKQKVRILYQKLEYGNIYKIDKRGVWREIIPKNFYYNNHEYFLNFFSEEGKEEKIKLRRILKAQVLSEKYYATQEANNDFMQVEMRCKNEFLQEVLESFGEDVELRASGKEHFVAKIEFDKHGEILENILKFGTEAEVLAPLELRAKIRKKIFEMSKLYKLHL